MRKLSRRDGLTKDYGTVVLWADDLKEIMEIVSGSENVLFVVDEYAYDSVEEFIRESRGKLPRKVTVSTERPFINVELYPTWTRISILPISLSKDELVSLGIFQKIDRVLTRCERQAGWLYKPYTAPLLVLGGLGINLIPGIPIWLRLTISVAMWVAVAWSIFAAKVVTRTHSLVRPFFRVEDKGFFQRNRDQVWLAVFSAVVGAFFGAVASKVADKVVSNTPQAVERASEKSAKSP